MAINLTYYIDTDSFNDATSIWTNSDLTIKAADGFYQQNGFYRQMSGGELLPSTICPECTVPCGESIIANELPGIYYLNTDLGSPVGAVVIRFNPITVPDGIKAIYDTVVYNGLSSPTYGWLQGTNGLHTFIGRESSDCGIVAGSPYTLDEFQYYENDFSPLGTNKTITVLAGQMDLTELAPGNTVMVIPKIAAIPSILNIELIGICSSVQFNISVDCPVALPSFDSSTVNTTSELACSVSPTQTYYVAHVNGASGVLGLYDLVFSDPNGQFKLAAGFYKTNDAGANEWYQVDANGVIVLLGECAFPVTGLAWDLTVNNPCDATPWTISNQNLKIRYDITDSVNCGGTCDQIQAGTATATITVGAVDVNMGLSFEGIGELQAADFEKITFSLDGALLASANAAGGGLGCQMGPVIQSFTQAPPYLLLANSVHTLFIDFTTNDAQFHVGSFYEVDLTFVEIP